MATATSTPLCFLRRSGGLKTLSQVFFFLLSKLMKFATVFFSEDEAERIDAGCADCPEDLQSVDWVVSVCAAASII